MRILLWACNSRTVSTPAKLRHQINELKKTYSQQDDLHDYNFRPTQSYAVDGSGLLYSQVKPIERIEILSTLPPKLEVDRLIARFFDHQNFPIAVAREYFLYLARLGPALITSLAILHQPTFMREVCLNP